MHSSALYEEASATSLRTRCSRDRYKMLLLLLLLHAVTDVTDNGPLSTSSHLMLAGKLRTMTDFVNRNTD